MELKTSQYLVWPPFASCSATHLLLIELIRLLIVACGMLSHSSSMAVQRCKGSQTCSVGVWWVCRPWKNWAIFSFQELCTDPSDMWPCIIMLKHEVMVADEWHDNGPQDLVMASLFIQMVIDKMQLCSLSVAYACPYHNSPPPWCTLFTTLTSVMWTHLFTTFLRNMLSVYSNCHR